MKTAANNREAVAVVGMSCRFPGASDPDLLWELVCRREESIGEYPDGRTPELDAFYARTGLPDGPPTRRGGFLPKIDCMDAAFFEVSPREAEWLDPQQRLLLELGWEALEDAGIASGSLQDSGVFMGVWLNDYERHATAYAPAVEFFNVTGGPLYGASSRLAYQFDMRGPELSVNASCSSSLVALHLAVRSLRAGECSLALAGGANVMVRPETTQAYSRAGVLSPEGRCRFGDAGANGFVRSEGAGILVLKRLSDALNDRDRILALIRGTAVTHKGRSGGFLTAPGSAEQQRAMREALADAGVEAATVDYLEAHGTGTPAGDPVEISALGAVFGQAPGRSRPCRAASVKSNIGHTESAAGVAGVIRTIQVLRHRRFPATLHVRSLNPAVDWAAAGIQLECEGAEWTRPESHPRRASVNSLGLTGTNAHVILEEAPETERMPVPALPAYLIPLSAASEAALRQRAADTAQAWRSLNRNGSAPMGDIGYTAAVRRSHLPHRIAVTATTPAEICERLEAFARREEAPFVAAGAAVEQRRIAFVFPGQGSQWIGMGRELLRTSNTFRGSMEALDVAVQQETGWSVIQQLDDPVLEERLSRIDVVQPVLFAMEVALAELWKSWGICPDAVVGHSMGEIAAACVAGILSLEHAAQIICRRSSLLTRVAGAGAMVVVELNQEEAQRAIAGAEGEVSVAVCNSPRSTVLAGDPGALETIVACLEQQDVFCRWVRVDVASHSPQMDVLKSDLARAVAGVQPRAGSVPLCSTVRAGMLDGSAMNAAYWVDNLRQPVLFSSAVAELLQQGINTFVEMSPHPILVPFLEQMGEQAGTAVLVAGSLLRQEPETGTLLHSLGRLYAAGVDPAWGALYPAGNRVELPAYPWQRERFWMEGAVRGNETSPGASADRDLSQEDALPVTDLGRSEPQTATRQNDTRNSTTSRDHDAADLELLQGEELRLQLAGWIRRQVASVLRQAPERVPDDKPLRTLGLDSLMALELRRRLEKQLQFTLSATLVWNYPTVAALAAHLQPRIESSVQHGTTRETPRETTTAAADRTLTEASRISSAAQLLEAELLETETLLSR